MIELRLPIDQRSSPADLAQLRVKGADGALVSLAELGRWQSSRVDQTIYHKNLRRVAYVFAETAGRRRRRQCRQDGYGHAPIAKF